MSDTAYPSVNDLTLEEKASLTSGGDAWHLQGVETKGIPGYMITDGPHGLRKSLASSTGETDLNDSVPATCFPPAAGLSSSWNPELIHRVGEAMGGGMHPGEGRRHPRSRRQHQAQSARRPLLRILVRRPVSGRP